MIISVGVALVRMEVGISLENVAGALGSVAVAIAEAHRTCGFGHKHSGRMMNKSPRVDFFSIVSGECRTLSKNPSCIYLCYLPRLRSLLRTTLFSVLRNTKLANGSQRKKAVLRHRAATIHPAL